MSKNPREPWRGEFRTIAMGFFVLIIAGFCVILLVNVLNALTVSVILFVTKRSLSTAGETLAYNPHFLHAISWIIVLLLWLILRVTGAKFITVEGTYLAKPLKSLRELFPFRFRLREPLNKAVATVERE
jgi:hypothetical protein